MKDYYLILGVLPDAEDVVIKATYVWIEIVICHEHWTDWWDSRCLIAELAAWANFYKSWSAGVYMTTYLHKKSFNKLTEQNRFMTTHLD